MTTRSCLATGINSIRGSSLILEQKPISYFCSFNPFRISSVMTLSQCREKSICLPWFSSRNFRKSRGTKSLPRVRRKAISIRPSPFPASCRLPTEVSSFSRISSASVRNDFPYLVRVTFRPFFLNNFTPSSDSREEMAWLRLGCVIASRSAARV